MGRIAEQSDTQSILAVQLRRAAASNPAAYNLMSLSNYFTSKTISVGSLVRPYPQMNGLSLYQPLGQSHFQEVLASLNRRYSNGLTLMASSQINALALGHLNIA